MEALKWFLSDVSSIKPDQATVNDAFCYAATNNHLSLMKWFFTEDCTVKPDQYVVNNAFIETASRNDLTSVKWFLSDSCPTKFDRYTLERVFSEAARSNDVPIVEWFLSDSCPTKIGQGEVDRAFIYAVNPNCIPMLKWFLSDSCPMKLSNAPWDPTINEAFVQAVNFNYLSVAEWFLSDDCPIKPDQSAVNESISLLHQQIPLLQWILSDAFPIKPDQDSVNKALLEAGVKRESPDMIIYLLDPQRPIRPDSNTLCSLYRNLQNGNLSEITKQVRRHLILNHLPQEHRQRLLEEHSQGGTSGQGRGVAFEIHDFSNIVFDEAMEHVSSLLNEESLPSAQQVQALLFQKGSKLFNNADQSKVFEAILIALSPEYMEKLAKVLHFIQSNHGDKIDLWIHSFIGDSIAAYDNSLRTLSCSKGVKERIVTGLRTLGDEDLNRIFLKAEAPLLIAKKFALFNLHDESMKASRIQDLKTLGVTADISLEELALRIREMVTHKFEGDTLSEAETTTVEEIITLLIEQIGSDRNLFHI